MGYLVHTPKFYERTDQAYPVVILLDGDLHFAHVSAAMDLLTEQGRIPPAILVGVNNVNRVANLTPPLGQVAPAGPVNPTTPNGDKFLRFLSGELVPQIDHTYRTRPYRVLIGHSAGGLFVVYSLLQSSPFFNGFIAVSPAIDREYEALIEATPSFLASHKSLRADVFLAIGNESGRMLANIWRLSAHLSQNPPWANPNVRWRLNEYPEEDHGTISLHAMEQGLRSIFDGWHLEAEAALALFEHGGLAALQKHYAGVSERMGYSVPVPRSAYDSVVEALRRRNRTDDAKVVLQQAMDTYPQDPEFHFVMGQLYVFTDRPRALEYFAKSLQASPTAYRNAMVSSYKVDAGELLPEVQPPLKS